MAGIRAVFAAADLLQARAVVLIDADVTGMTPDWVAELARPIWKNEADLALPIHPRGRFDGPLVSQLVRPLLGTAYARRLRSDLAGDFACSGGYAARMVKHAMWEDDLTRPALDVWLVTTAMAEDLRLVQVHLGPRKFASHGALSELFKSVVGTALTCLDRHASVWPSRTEPADVPMRGEHRDVGETDSIADPAPMSERFRVGVADLEPMLRDILTDETLGRIKAAAASDAKYPSIPDSLWVTTVYEFAASAHRGVMNREHLTQALVPLYLGRVASFFSDIVAADEDTYTERLATLEHEFGRLRPYFLELWNADGRR